VNNYVTANTIKKLREKSGLTQTDLAEKLSVSDKTISKWETGRGLPDISLLEPLANALSISVTELLSGECVVNSNVSANMLKTKYYVCPICGNVIHGTGDAVINCCGVTLPVLEAEEDTENIINVQMVETDYYVTIDHPMTKDHYISFIAYNTFEKNEVVKLYPEGNAEARFFMGGRGNVLAYCNKHGLIQKKL